jgi:hypothetical protein
MGEDIGVEDTLLSFPLWTLHFFHTIVLTYHHRSITKIESEEESRTHSQSVVMV